MRGLLRGVACGLALLAAGCVPPKERTGGSGDQAVPRDIPALATAGRHVARPAIDLPGPVPQRPALHPMAVDPDPERILEEGPDTVRAVLGPPTRVRSEPPARIWQYVSERCVLDVFLYERDGGREAVYLDARDRDAAPTDAAACLRALLTQRAAPDAGGV